ncbi:fat cadherin-related tumor suppressor-like, partial [Tropilaelaps mercedesae]
MRDATGVDSVQIYNLISLYLAIGQKRPYLDVVVAQSTLISARLNLACLSATEWRRGGHRRYDPDQGVNGEIYYNLAEPSQQFAIHPTLGSISLTRPLDFRRERVINLTVEARDRGPKLGTGPCAARPNAASRRLTGDVAARLDFPRENSGGRLRRALESTGEAISGGGDHLTTERSFRTSVLRVAWPLETDHLPPPWRRLRRPRAAPNSPEQSSSPRPGVGGDSSNRLKWLCRVFCACLFRCFRLSNRNVVVRVTFFCASPILDTVIKASTAKVTINVLPANRHKPRIVVKNLQSYIEHGVGPETWAVVQVTDDDTGPNGHIGGLAITDGDLDGQFRVHNVGPGEYNVDFDPRNGATGESRGYNLTLRAWDKGTPSLFSDQSVFIRVSPSLGAITPVFDKDDDDVQIQEVAPPNSPIVRVSAHLPHEESHNDVIVYRVETGDEDGVFDINPKTGQISTKRWLDRETRRYYSLTVSATNTKSRSTRHRTGAAVATTIVNINVLDCNDNAPRFNTSIQSVVIIDENVPVGTKVVTVSATDADDGENGYVSYALANTNKVPFKISPFTGVVTTSEVIDYESMSTSYYMLRIRAIDWGSPFQRQSEVTVRVQVRDLNDHRPQFEKVDCAVSVNSQTPIGTAILTLSAIDLDLRDLVTYRMEPASEHQCFSLDPQSGILSVACDASELVDLDDVTLNVSATDGEHFADSMHVKVKIDKYSQDRNHLLKSRKDERWKPHVECREAGLTKRLKEFLLARGSADRGGGADHTDDAVVSHSFFENRFAPEFPKASVEISVNESLPTGSVLARLRAKDADHGYNGQLVYVVASGDDDSCFQMDLYRGNLILVEPLDRERTPKYVLNVTVYDLGEPKKSAWMTAVIYVLDVNDNVPVFEKPQYKFKISEAVSKGALVAKLRATDADDGDNARIRYRLASETHDFTVDEKSGILIVQHSLDRERQAEYNLMVKATDSSLDIPLTGTTMVNIQVQDVNDEPPQFTLKSYATRVREDLPKGTVIMTMSAQDPDLEDGGKVNYQMMNKDLKHLFDIDAETGIVRLIGELDFEKKARLSAQFLSRSEISDLCLPAYTHSVVHTFSIERRYSTPNARAEPVASDSGEPKPLHTDGFLVVELEDVNENRHAPKFADVVVQAAVDENLPIGAFVLNVSATDDDDPSKLDGMVTYRIIGGDGL